MKKRPRRSWLLTLTADDRKVEKAAAGNADVLILDLSDSVTPDRKAHARGRVVEWLTGRNPFGDKELVIKPNNLWSEWGRADLEAVAGLPTAAIYYPEPTTAEEVQIVCDALDAAGSGSEIVVLLENARSFLNLRDMCSVKRVTTLCHAQGDLAMNLGVKLKDSRETLLYTASMTVLHARAFGLQSIDTILPSDLRDAELAKTYAQSSKDLGFTSCSTFYAPHVDAINAVFTPSDDRLSGAREIVARYEKERGEGKAAYVREDGVWITLHQYKQARELVMIHG